MSDRLLELAEKAGVATWGPSEPIPTGSGPRPRLDIAHDLLEKAPLGRFELAWTQYGLATKQIWAAFDLAEKQCGEDIHQPFYKGTFEECVVALAERAMK